MEYKPGGLAGQELRGVECAPGEAVAVQGAVTQFEGFAHQAEDDGVLARAVGDPQGVDADLARRRTPASPGWPGTSRLAAIPARRPPPAARPSRSVRPSWSDDAARRSRCRPRAQHPRGLAHQLHQRLTARLMLGEIRIGMSARRRLQLAALLRLEPGRADDQRDAPCPAPRRRSPGPPAASRSRS